MSPQSLKFAAICAALSALTTFLLWWLPRLYDAPQDFSQALALHANPYYLSRLWVNFGHIFLALTGYGAAAYLLWRHSPALAALGFLWFILWGFTELLGVSISIFAVNATWRAQFASATPEVEAQLRTHLQGFEGMWDALFFLLLVAFLLGSLAYGAAAVRGRGIERGVGWLFLLAVPLTAAIMLGGYAGIGLFDPFVNWLYPVLQPASRAMLGYWLWSQAANNRVEPTR